jgi:hypothetical protein
MVLIYQPPNAHVRISWILPCNAMAAAAVKKIYIYIKSEMQREMQISYFKCLDFTWPKVDGPKANASGYLWLYKCCRARQQLSPLPMNMI